MTMLGLFYGLRTLNFIGHLSEGLSMPYDVSKDLEAIQGKAVYRFYLCTSCMSKQEVDNMYKNVLACSDG